MRICILFLLLVSGSSLLFFTRPVELKTVKIKEKGKCKVKFMQKGLFDFKLPRSFYRVKFTSKGDCSDWTLPKQTQMLREAFHSRMPLFEHSLDAGSKVIASGKRKDAYDLTCEFTLPINDNTTKLITKRASVKTAGTLHFPSQWEHVCVRIYHFLELVRDHKI